MCFCYRTPVPLVPGVPTKTRLECRLKTFTLHFMCRPDTLPDRGVDLTAWRGQQKLRVDRVVSRRGRFDAPINLFLACVSRLPPPHAYGA